MDKPPTADGTGPVPTATTPSEDDKEPLVTILDPTVNDPRTARFDAIDSLPPTKALPAFERALMWVRPAFKNSTSPEIIVPMVDVAFERDTDTAPRFKCKLFDMNHDT